jgi:hypothetical protein
MVPNETPRRHDAKRGAFRGQKGGSRPWLPVRSGRADARERSRASRQDTRRTGGTIPTNRTSASLACARLHFVCVPTPKVGIMHLLSQPGRIVPQVPSGATMPQTDPGAVGDHGCRRREATLPCATERCAHPRLRRLAVLQRNGEIRGIDRKRGSVRAGRTWPYCGVTLPLRSPCELKALPVSATPGRCDLMTPPIWVRWVRRTARSSQPPRSAAPGGA